MSDIGDQLAEHFPDERAGGWGYCMCGFEFQTFEEWGAHALSALGLTRVWSDDIAGPDWQRYSYWRTPTESHPGPKRIAAGLG